MSTPAKRPAYEPPGRLLRPTGFDPDMKRPVTTVAGAVLVFLRAAVGLLFLAELGLNWNVVAMQSTIEIDGLTDAEAAGVGLTLLLVIGLVVVVADVILGIVILRGHNWARVVVMFLSVISIATAFGAWWAEDLEITLKTSLLSTALDTLILLALSSRSAAAYARRHEQR
ncbi:hypothetical protein G5T42_06890 [Microbacterium sp. 4R-513]|uniref:hypothetical protein n=1 Tax=Microbacterium sp. 4R-513 TaxID=2567934 RepID=UPI0013E144F4|nr:hypothetical protein [Microbacterium sp. 4R-513]QIG39246.1 hypothetical protein G5T42_06890 [Microbacterium sp. 4R-513]